MTTKTMLVRHLKKAGMTIKEAEFYVNLTIDFFSESLIKGETLVLSGFGTFCIKPQEQKLSGLRIIPKHNRIIFNASRKLRKAINGKPTGK